MKRNCKYETWLPDYIEGTLDEAVSDKFEEHLADCAGCIETAALLTAIRRQEEGSDLDTVPPEFTLSTLASIRALAKGDSGLLKRLAMKAQAVSRLSLVPVRTIFAQPWQPAPARGQESAGDAALVRVKRNLRGATVEVEIERTAPGTALLRILLPNPSPGWRNARVTLKRGRREIGSYPLDEGYVVIEDVDFGHYNLLFSRNGAEMGRIHFQIRETPDER